MSKEKERNELHKTIWNIATELRGAIDGWDFKQYVLGTLFYRFISENLTNYINKEERKQDPNFDYATEMEKIIAENKISIGDMIDIDFYIQNEKLL